MAGVPGQVPFRYSLIDSPTTTQWDWDTQLTASMGWGMPTSAWCFQGSSVDPVSTTRPAWAAEATALPTATHEPIDGQDTSLSDAADDEIG